jgi:fructose-specific phosphotransferase system IIA component
MRLGELIDERSIDLYLEPQGREAVIETLVNRLAESGLISDREEVLDAVLERERALSTGVGAGVAVPHATVEGLERAVVSFGRSLKGVEFGALDEKPVRLVFLLLAPQEEISLHLKLLSRVSRLCNSKTFREALLAASNPADVLNILREHESELQEL